MSQVVSTSEINPTSVCSTGLPSGSINDSDAAHHRPEAPAGPSHADVPAPVPFLVIRPSRGWSALNLREVWQFRDLLMTLAGWISEVETTWDMGCSQSGPLVRSA